MLHFFQKLRTYLTFQLVNNVNYTSEEILLKKVWFALVATLLMCSATPAVAQHIAPTLRFHESDSPYWPYFDNHLSGFMQTTTNGTSANGFLQMPFVGDPSLVYIGEKDSTQFMAYASTFTMEKDENAKHFKADITRYGIHADIKQMPAYCLQEYTFPDTLASKGFLLDIDNAASGRGNEDMDVVFITKQTIRAYKRSIEPDGHTPDLYYVAHFSHPFHQWNVRREVVKLENGQKEKRCKAAFIFDLKKGEKLIVQSYVSSLSTNDALARLNTKEPKVNINDKRKYPVVPSNALAQNVTSPSAKGSDVTSRNARSVSSTRSMTSSRPSNSGNNSAYNVSTTDIIEYSTRDAELKAAFSIALAQLKRQVPKSSRNDALALIDYISLLYAKTSETMRHASVEMTDSLIDLYAKRIFTGDKAQTSTEDTAWFLFNAMGFVPNDASTSEGFRLVRPAFNVVTLHLPRGRRFILHCKRNSANNRYIESANFARQAPLDDLQFSQAALARGGILEVKMSPNSRQ